MSLHLPENDPFYKKQPIRIRKRRLQESSRLGQKNLQQELEALPLLKGIFCEKSIVFHEYKNILLY
jgi:hypothetical protein